MFCENLLWLWEIVVKPKKCYAALFLFLLLSPFHSLSSFYYYYSFWEEIIFWQAYSIWYNAQCLIHYIDWAYIFEYMLNEDLASRSRVRCYILILNIVTVFTEHPLFDVHLDTLYFLLFLLTNIFYYSCYHTRLGLHPALINGGIWA